ncbi:MAG: DNA polymerase III subunit delta [Bacteroidota bacterium]
MSKKGLSYEQLRTALQHRNYQPLYFLYGTERFLIDELQTLLLETALEPHERDFNQDILYGAEVTAQAALALCAQYPMMAERRVVVIRDFEKMKDNRLFTEFAKRPNPSAVVLAICNGKPNLSSHPYRALKQHGAWGEFKPLYDNQMPSWIQNRAKQMGYRLEPQGVQMLADFVGTDLRAAVAELDKLITFAGGRTQLTADDVVAASGQTRDFNVFELQRAIGQHRYADAVFITERLLQNASASRGEALMIVSVLTSYFTKLWKLTVCQQKRMKDNEMARRIGVSPFFVKEYVQSVRRFPPASLERAFNALLAADYELKGGSPRDERLILTLLMRRLMPAPALA